MLRTAQALSVANCPVRTHASVASCKAHVRSSHLTLHLRGGAHNREQCPWRLYESTHQLQPKVPTSFTTSDASTNPSPLCTPTRQNLKRSQRSQPKQQCDGVRSRDVTNLPKFNLFKLFNAKFDQCSTIRACKIQADATWLPTQSLKVYMFAFILCKHW